MANQPYLSKNDEEWRCLNEAIHNLEAVGGPARNPILAACCRPRTAGSATARLWN